MLKCRAGEILHVVGEDVVFEVFESGEAELREGRTEFAFVRMLRDRGGLRRFRLMATA